MLPPGAQEHRSNHDCCSCGTADAALTRKEYFAGVEVYSTGEGHEPFDVEARRTAGLLREFVLEDKAQSTWQVPVAGRLAFARSADRHQMPKCGPSSRRAKDLARATPTCDYDGPFQRFAH